jgi:hypothetical protein
MQLQAQQQQHSSDPAQQAWLQRNQQQAAGMAVGIMMPMGMMPMLMPMLNTGTSHQVMMQQQQQHGLPFSSDMALSYQQHQGSMGMLAAQQQLMYQQQLTGMGMGQQGGMGNPAVAWGGMGMGVPQHVLDLSNLPPFNTGVAANAMLFGSAAAGSASAAAASAAAVGRGEMQQGLGGEVLRSGQQQTRGVGSSAQQQQQQQEQQQQQQQMLQPMELPGSLTELGGAEDEAIATSPFGQLGLDAADVDALLAGFEPTEFGPSGQGADVQSEND